MLKKKFAHITTPIFYPNAKPHLGHLYSSLICDVRNRWNAMNGYETKFTTGTDEHGLKIQNAACLANVSPKRFVDRLALDFQKLDQEADIKYTRFIRTTDEDHVENVRSLWAMCRDYIYKGEHKGWYSISDETFYPESQILQLLPNGTEIPFEAAKFNTTSAAEKESLQFINTESRNKVTYQSEINYFFKLSQFQDKLIGHIRDTPGFIRPERHRESILRILEAHPLQDLSISRPSSRLNWAIEVPGDESQKIYVWFDALCNYITSVGKIESLVCDKNTSDSANLVNKSMWEATSHIIGKDIIKFHCIYWPIFLMACNIALPKEIIVHGHWLSEGVKMSKSLGNVVDPLVMIDYYGCDSVRWYILENSSIDTDGDFNEENLHLTRSLFVGKWGNLINRCCSTKFDLERAIARYHGKNFDELRILKEGKELDLYDILIKELEEFPVKLNEYMMDYNYQQALKHFWKILNDANNFVQFTEPWKCKDEERQDLIVYVGCETCRLLSILSQPFIPELSEKFMDRLNIIDRDLQNAKIWNDSTYGKNCNVKGNLPLTKIDKRFL